MRKIALYVRVLVVLGFIAGIGLQAGVGHAQEDTPPQRPTMSTSGAVGTPTTLQLPSGVLPQVASAAAQSIDDWTPDVEEGFEGDLSAWSVFDNSDDGADRTWGLDDFYANSGTQSVWVAAGGVDGLDPQDFYYPDNLDTWLVYNNVLDLTNAQAADVEFYMNMDVEPDYDYVFAGVSTDGVNFNGDYWTGDSGGWNWYSIDLSAYIGEPEVYIGFYFYSDESNPADYEGVWIDDVTVWTYVDTPRLAANDAVQNGDFETGDLSGWTVPDGSTVITTKAENPISGDYVAYFGGINDGEEIFYQTLQIPSSANSAHISFYANSFGPETEEAADSFCAGLYSSDMTTLILDLGCIDGVEVFGPDFDPDGWWQVDYAVTGDEWETIKGQTLNLAFEMYTDGSLPTTVFIDDVVFETASGGAPSDGNDSTSGATPATPGTELSNLSIDPDLDQDFYSFTANAGDTIAADISAAVVGSGLDSYIQILDPNGNVICENDDDGSSYDSYASCTTSSSGTHYVMVRSYDGSGDRSYTYSLLIQVAGGDIPTPTATPEPSVTPPPSGATKRAWTAIIYIDGDNNLCDSYPGLITRMEQELGSRIGAGGFLNIAVLFDRAAGYCSGGGSTRLLIQPNGAYQDNVNRWDMGEVNMGDPQTLITFAKWAMSNYPADHYYLAIDNHGGGTSGISWDDSNGHDNITNDELYSALKEITNNGDTPIDVFAYEACLMGMYENAYDARKFTKYLFFFPTISWTNNASYPSYLGDSRFSATSDGLALGEIIFDVYFNAVQNPYSVSLVDSSKLDGLYQAVNSLADALAGANATQSANIRAARAAAQKIDQDGNNVLDESDAYIDLWDLADQIAKLQSFGVAEANAVKAAVDGAVIRTGYRPATAGTPVDYSKQHGLSIYWPRTASGDYNGYVNDRIYSSTTEGRWDNFLRTFFGDGGARGGMNASYGAIDRRPADLLSGTQIFLPSVVR